MSPKMTQKCSKMYPKIYPFATLDFWYRFYALRTLKIMFLGLRTRILIKFIQYLPVGFDVVLFGAELGPLPFRGRFLLPKSDHFGHFCEPESFQKRL